MSTAMNCPPTALPAPPAARHAALRRAILLVVALSAVGALLYALRLANSYPRTDDAFVQADTIGVASQVAGRVASLQVKNNAAVRKGEILFTLDARPFELDAERLRAQLATLEQQILLARRQVSAQQYAAQASTATVARAADNAAQRQSTLARLEPLLADEFVTREQVDQARTARNTAAAELQAATLEQKRAVSAVSGVEALTAQRRELAAAIAHADYQLEQTVVRAPFDGRVVDLHLSEGEFATPGKPLFTLIDTRAWYVVANFRETELAKLRPGAAAQVYLMSDPAVTWSGSVESIGWGVLPDEGGSVQGLPKVPKSINWVHVAQRFPVRIRIARPASDLFRIGASAVVTLDGQAPRP